jgi:hypothetical protein
VPQRGTRMQKSQQTRGSTQDRDIHSWLACQLPMPSLANLALLSITNQTQHGHVPSTQHPIQPQHTKHCVRDLQQDGCQVTLDLPHEQRFTLRVKPTLLGLWSSSSRSTRSSLWMTGGESAAGRRAGGASHNSLATSSTPHSTHHKQCKDACQTTAIVATAKSLLKRRHRS